MDLFKKLSLALLVSGLSACGGGGNSEDTAPAANSQSDTVIHSFSVTGSGTNGDVTQINAGINNGEFLFRWNLSAEKLYHVNLYLSEDAISDDSTDRRVFSRNCNITLSDCQSFSAEYPCKFTNENKMECGLPGNIITTNVTGFVNTLPKDGYLVLKACDAMGKKCDEEAVKIQLQ